MAEAPAPCALILMGVSGSGKSTVAKALAVALNWTYEDGDRFHPKANVEKMSAGHPLTDADRAPWLQAIADEIDRGCKTHQHLVIACSALKRTYRDILVHGRDDVCIVYLKGSRDLIARRLAERKKHFMPPELLDSQFDTLEEPTPDENAIAIPIDGSIAQTVDDIVARLRSEGELR